MITAEPATTHAHGESLRRSAAGSEDGVAGIRRSVSRSAGAAGRVVIFATCRSYMAFIHT
jgi:hypothetical protein